MESQFFEKYKIYFEPEKTPVLFSIMKEPQIKSALDNNKMPTKKVVEKIFGARGILLNDVSESSSVKVKTQNTQTVDLLQKLNLKVDLILSTINRNIDVFKGNLETTLLMTNDEKMEYQKKCSNLNTLKYQFSKTWNFELNKSEDLPNFEKVLQDGISMIDKIMNNSFFKSSKTATQIISDMFIIISDNLDPSRAIDSDPLYSKNVFEAVQMRRQESRTFLGEDVIIFIPLKLGSSNIETYSLSFYCDKTLLINAFRKRIARDKGILIDSIIVEDEALPSEEFMNFFLEACMDAYTHAYCSIVFGESLYNHSNLFDKTYNKLFGV